MRKKGANLRSRRNRGPLNKTIISLRGVESQPVSAKGSIPNTLAMYVPVNDGLTRSSGVVGVPRHYRDRAFLCALAY